MATGLLPRPVRETIEIKPLKWRGGVAPSLAGEYRIVQRADGLFDVKVDDSVIGGVIFDWPSALAAAQADYEARIRSVLKADFAEIVAPYAAALRMVCEAVEDLFGPVANLESEEAILLGSQPRRRAEALIAALQTISRRIASKPAIEWKADASDWPELADALIATTGSIQIGHVTASGSGRWRWEIASMPGMSSYRDDRAGWKETEEEAKKTVEKKWSDWLEMAGLSKDE